MGDIITVTELSYETIPKYYPANRCMEKGKEEY